MKTIKCPKCNQEFNVNENENNLKCKYCNTDIVFVKDKEKLSMISIYIGTILFVAIVGIILLYKLKDGSNNYGNNMNNNSNNTKEEIKDDKPSEDETKDDKPSEDETKDDKPSEDETKDDKPSEDEIIYDKNTTKNDFIYEFDSEFSDIKRVEGKVNIYVFWGEGCPHCAELHQFLDTLKDKYKDYFNLYGFEVWYNSNNSRIAHEFAEAMGDEFAGVPYYVIGKKSFAGYISSWNKDIINAIESAQNETFDVYFDVIKKNE